MERKFIVLTKKANALCEKEIFDVKPEDLKDDQAIIETSMSLVIQFIQVIQQLVVS